MSIFLGALFFMAVGASIGCLIMAMIVSSRERALREDESAFIELFNLSSSAGPDLPPAPPAAPASPEAGRPFSCPARTPR